MTEDAKRFASLKRLAEWKERDAAARFGRQRRERDAALQRLEELRLYHREYLERYLSAGRDSGSVARMRDYQSFIDKLEAAIAEQERIVAQLGEVCDLARHAWTAEYTNAQSMSHILQKKREEEAREQLRSEQRQQDDRGPRRSSY